MAYRVLVVDDFRMSRIVFETAIASSDRYELAASLSLAEEAADYCRKDPVDLIIMDVVMNRGRSGLSAAKEIKSFSPKTKILLVTSMPEVSFIERAKEIGIESFWYKEVETEPILNIMDKTMEGLSIYPDSSPDIELGNIRASELTEREVEVLRELVGGHANKDIAYHLSISEETVKTHIKNLLQKTGFRSRLELAVKARVAGAVISEEE